MTLVPLSEECSVRCVGYVPSRDGMVKVYVLEVAFNRARSPLVLRLTPAQMSSHTAFKRVMIQHCVPFPLPWNKAVFNSITRNLFETPPVELEPRL
jgi:hypothetical protein